MLTRFLGDHYQTGFIKNDIKAGLSVFLVALPLCLGIALASGAPLYSGIISGIIGGLAVPLIIKAVFSVSGPSASIPAIAAFYILSLGNYQLFFLSVIIAGLFQILLGLFRLGGFAQYFPTAVIKGLSAGIGIGLIAKQIPLIIGHDGAEFWKETVVQLFVGGDFLEEIHSFSSETSLFTILVASISLLCIILLKHPILRSLSAIPMPLIIVTLGVLMNWGITDYLNVHGHYKLLRLVEVSGNLFADFSFPDFSALLSNSDVWLAGIVVGVVASLETSLCVEAVDKLDPLRRTTPANRELVAQGIGNVGSGILGGLPMAAVIIRGSVNISAGAQSKLSSMINGLFLLLSVLFIPFLLNQIPYATLAAILLVTGYNLTHPSLYKSMWRLGYRQFVPFIVTVVGIIFTDLLVGVELGIATAVIFIIGDHFRPMHHVERDGNHYTITLHHYVSFLGCPQLRKCFNDIPEGSTITIDGSRSKYVDLDVVEVVNRFVSYEARPKQITVKLKGMKKFSQQ